MSPSPTFGNLTPAQAAEIYVSLGMELLMVHPRSKAPVGDDWHTRPGITDPASARFMFMNPEQNIGFKPGNAFVVIDIDTKKGGRGRESLKAVIDRCGALPETVEMITASGGGGLIYRVPAGVRLPFQKKMLGLPDLEFRVGAVNCIFPPSRVMYKPGELGPEAVTGQHQWKAGCAPGEIEFAELPLAIAEAVLAHEVEGGGTATTSKPKAEAGRIKPGSRNDTLFREASRLRAQGLAEEAIEAQLIHVNRSECDEPLPEDEVRNIARSAMRYAPNERFDRNDVGNAERFIRDHGGTVRYVSDQDRWRVWDAACWRDDADGAAMRLAMATVEGMKRDAELIGDARAARAAAAWARSSGDQARMRAMLKVAASMPGISAHSTDFDNLPHILIVQNGAVDLRTGELSPHDASRLTTRSLAVPYDPGAQASRFTAFLECVQPNPEVQTFLQRSLGHALHGVRRERMLAVWHGRGANGKSVLADVLMGVLGAYAMECPATTFVVSDKRAANAPRSDLLRLQGARVVLGTEVPDRRRLDGQLVKKVTGDAALTERGLYSSETTFPITFGVNLMSNPFPAADEADDALWDRLVRVPFNIVIPRTERDTTLARKIIAEEATGVLAWLVRGAVDYEREGLTMPPILIAATEEWRRRAGTVQRFVQNRLRRVEGGAMRLIELHRHYLSFAGMLYANPVGVENFRARLEGLGWQVTDEEDGETVCGVQLAPVTSVGAGAAGS